MNNTKDLIEDKISSYSSIVSGIIFKNSYYGFVFNNLTSKVYLQTETKLGIETKKSIYLKIAKQCQLEQSLEAN